MKKGIIMSDMHCGSIVGLTPPAYNVFDNSERGFKTRDYRSEMWINYREILNKIGPIDFLIHNGDATDGMQKRQGSTDLIGEGWLEQIRMATYCLQVPLGSPDKYMTYGTEYHTMTADGVDVEHQIASVLHAKISDRLFVEIDGVLFDLRHFIGASSHQHLRHTALARENAVNCERVVAGEYERTPDVIVRSHVHYYVKDGGVNGGREWMGLVTPSLQGLGGKFGARKCSNIVHWGLIEIHVHEGEVVKCKPWIPTLQGSKMAIIQG